MMEIMLAAVQERLEALHEDLDRAVAGLSQAELDWSPGEGMNSIAVLAAHVAGSERYWIGELAGGEPSGRVRDAEFQTRGVGDGQLRANLAKSLAHSKTVLARLTEQDLESATYNVHWGRDVSTATCLAHVLEHTGTHLGHMQMVRDLIDKEK
ncbi:MAG: DinB family protein [Anaerolineales bacterium]|nr:DinB family protein [Anaerolineales bacterium]